MRNWAANLPIISFNKRKFLYNENGEMTSVDIENQMNEFIVNFV